MEINKRLMGRSGRMWIIIDSSITIIFTMFVRFEGGRVLVARMSFVQILVYRRWRIAALDHGSEPVARRQAAAQHSSPSLAVRRVVLAPSRACAAHLLRLAFLSQLQLQLQRAAVDLVPTDGNLEIYTENSTGNLQKLVDRARSIRALPWGDAATKSASENRFKAPFERLELGSDSSNPCTQKPDGTFVSSYTLIEPFSLLYVQCSCTVRPRQACTVERIPEF